MSKKMTGQPDAPARQTPTQSRQPSRAASSGDVSRRRRAEEDGEPSFDDETESGDEIDAPGSEMDEER